MEGFELISLRTPTISHTSYGSLIFSILVVEHSHLTFYAIFRVNCTQKVFVDALGLRVLQLIMDVLRQFLEWAFARLIFTAALGYIVRIR